MCKHELCAGPSPEDMQVASLGSAKADFGECGCRGATWGARSSLYRVLEPSSAVFAHRKPTDAGRWRAGMSHRTRKGVFVFWNEEPSNKILVFQTLPAHVVAQEPRAHR